MARRILVKWKESKMMANLPSVISAIDSSNYFV